MEDRRLTVYAELRLLVPLPLLSLEEQPSDVLQPLQSLSRHSHRPYTDRLPSTTCNSILQCCEVLQAASCVQVHLHPAVIVVGAPQWRTFATAG
ncbi:hypothetical protein EYF80_007605 [Liparis tanakae]|uniref:Uncharacterized protein n=1 Tax=Liparis tanakae TaxID=230148 RepID=A0A4Z2IWU9_9TELE|nr:hypothetical protein EYF80_007605 [Liparis tanakae]